MAFEPEGSLAEASLAWPSGLCENLAQTSGRAAAAGQADGRSLWALTPCPVFLCIAAGAKAPKPKRSASRKRASSTTGSATRGVTYLRKVSRGRPWFRDCPPRSSPPRRPPRAGIRSDARPPSSRPSAPTRSSAPEVLPPARRPALGRASRPTARRSESPPSSA